MFLFFLEDFSAALATSEDFPHLLGDIRIVLTDEEKFETSLSVSVFRSVKFSSAAILPKTNGISMITFYTNIRIPTYIT
ncbi:MAG: hypothetical protein NTV01_20305 [Bacteroidia bacterium]|nr:hypothetical protein [Bacteroidia bacterium]